MEEIKMKKYDDFNLDLDVLNEAGSISNEDKMVTVGPICVATWEICVPVSMNLCTPGGICDLTEECTNGCQGGPQSETHSYCGAAC